MRQTMRAAVRDGAERVAVVCGAWHAPALDGKLPAAAADARLLRGLPKVASSVTWVPWTSSRLAAASGYGAGIVSPGWYHHLFTAPDHTVARWLTRVAGVLRAEDLPVSSAHVIEGVRLAETLAGLRGRPAAGLDEVQEATRAVLCDGDDTMLDLVTRRLVVGESLGHVPGTRARRCRWRPTCGDRPPAADRPRGAGAHARARPAQGHRPAALPAPAPAAAARHRLGDRGGRARRSTGTFRRPGRSSGSPSCRSRSSRPPCGAPPCRPRPRRPSGSQAAAADLRRPDRRSSRRSCSPTCRTRSPRCSRRCATGRPASSTSPT